MGQHADISYLWTLAGLFGRRLDEDSKPVVATRRPKPKLRARLIYDRLHVERGILRRLGVK